MLNQDLVGAGFAAVPAGGDQEQVKACPPTKGRLSRGLPNLATRTLASAKEPRFGSRLFASWSKAVFWQPPSRLRGFFPEYERSLQSRKADFQDGARAVGVVGVHYRVGPVFGIAVHPLTLDSSDHLALVRKVHCSLRAVSFPSHLIFPGGKLLPIHRSGIRQLQSSSVLRDGRQGCHQQDGKR